MSSCDVFHKIVPLYVDGELAQEDLERFLAHVTGCARCQSILMAEQALSARIRRARPRIPAPASLRSELEHRMREANAELGPNAASGSALVPRKWRQSLAAAAMFLLVASGTVAVYEQQRHGGEAVVQAAVQAHEELQDHTTSLEIVSSSPAEVTSWFASRLPFPLQFANSGIASDEGAKYKLDGGKVLRIGNEPAALLLFHIPQEQVSMLVVPQHLLRASGGAVVLSGGIALHSRDVGPVHVVTWNNRGLAYVLSSKASMGNPRTCGTCHQKTVTP